MYFNLQDPNLLSFCLYSNVVNKRGIFLIYIFWPVESKSRFTFRGPKPETIDNTEKLKFQDQRRFLVLADENGYQIWILQVKEHLNSISSIRKIPAIPKIQSR